MKLIYLSFLLLLSKNIYAQNDNLKRTKYQFAKGVFKKEYKRESFERFSGEIKVKENSIMYDEKTFVLNDIDHAYLKIFTDGIFYPNIITGNQKAVLKSSAEIASMTVTQQVFYNMSRIDSLTISGFSDLKLINPNPSVRRFVFWLYNKGRLNPTECYIELENKKANKKTPLKDFIKDAKLTFFHRGSIII